jgi:hypothetical protein
LSKKHTIEDMKKLAKSRCGLCLSSEYVNSQTKLEWECSEGHRWLAVPAKISYGQWCSICSGNKKKTIDDMRNLALSQGGRCLSIYYKNNHDPLVWECSEGHIFKTSYSAVKLAISRGGFCSKCGILRRTEKKKLTIEEMRDIAITRGGKCLSDKYIDAHGPLTWVCGNGHQFDMNANSVKNNHWCPHCQFYLNENKCRYIIEKLTGKRFKSTKKILNGLELDGYNEELKLAFEYNGVQHYKFIEFFHKTYDEFLKRKEYDDLKKNLCDEKGISLITIPYTITNDTGLITYLYEKLFCLGKEPLIKVEDFDFDGFYRKSPILKELSDIAISRNGKLLSNHYFNNKTKLLWECEYGHQWEMRPNDIKSGQWCSICNGSHKLTIEEMDQIAKDRNGYCLSIAYINSREKLRWRCEKDHEWDASPGAVKQGTWCEICIKKENGKKRRLSIEEMHKIAKERGGKCLSSEYVNSQIHLLWECSCGNRWLARPDNIKNGNWCPRCKNKDKILKYGQLTLF